MAIIFETYKAESADIGQLLRVVIEAIVEVLIICLTGYIMGRRGVIDSRIKRSLNKLNQNIFTPALLFGKVAFTLNPAKLAELWIVPVGFVIVSLISALIALVMGYMFRLSKSQRAFAIACATFMNSNSLPIALMQSLTVTVEGLRWGQHDTKDAMLGRALSYLVLFSTLGIILRWSYGIKLLSTADEEGGKEEEEASIEAAPDRRASSGVIREDEQGDSARAPLMPIQEGETTGYENGDVNSTAPTPRRSRFLDGPVTINRPPDLRDVPRRGMPVRRWTALGSREDAEHADYFHRSYMPPAQRDFKREIANYRSFPNTPARTPAASTYTSSEAGSTSDEDEETLAADAASDGEDAYAGTGRRERTLPSKNRTQAWFRRNRRKCWSGYKAWIHRPVSRFIRGFQAFMTAPLYAALLSLIVACIRPVQLFLDQLLPVRNAIKSAGNCSVPITLLVLGSYFCEEMPQNATKSALRKRASTTSSLRQKFSALFSLPQEKQKDPRAKPGESRTVFVSVVSRMIVAPLVMIPLFAWWAVKTTNQADDPVFAVTAVLVIGSAPAITLAQMTTAAGNSFERLISKTLFASYVIMTFPTTIVLVLIGLQIAKAQM